MRQRRRIKTLVASATSCCRRRGCSCRLLLLLLQLLQLLLVLVLLRRRRLMVLSSSRPSPPILPLLPLVGPDAQERTDNGEMRPNELGRVDAVARQNHIGFCFVFFFVFSGWRFCSSV